MDLRALLTKLRNNITQSVSSIPQNIGNAIQQTPQYKGAQVLGKAIQQAPQLAQRAIPQVQQSLSSFGNTKVPFFGVSTTPKDAYNFVAPMWQYPLRTAAQLKQTPVIQNLLPGRNLPNQPLQPQGIGKIAFGEEPLKSYQQRYQGGYKLPFVDQMVSGPASLPLFGLGIAAGISPMGGAKKGAVNSVESLSTKAINSLKDKSVGIKAGAIEKAIAEIKAGIMPPVKIRTIEGGKIAIEDGRHHLEAARKLGIKNYPIEDVTKLYSKAQGVGGGGIKESPLYHYSDTKITNNVLKPGQPHPQNYLGDAVYVTNQKAGYLGKYEYQVEMPKGLKILDLTGGGNEKVGMNFAKKVANRLGISYEPQGQGLYDDLRWMEQQLSPDKINNKVVQTKIRNIVDEMTKGYDAIKAPYYDPIEPVVKNWELVIRNKEVPVSTPPLNQGASKSQTFQKVVGQNVALEKKIVEQVKKPSLTVRVQEVGGQSQGGQVPPSNGSIPQDQDLITRLTQALKTAEPVRGTQEALYKAARGEKLAKLMSAREKMAGEKGFFQELGALRGELPKAQYESIRQEFNQPSVDRLFNMVKENKYLDDWEKVNAQVGLAKVLGEKGGGVPTKGEIEKLYQVFGKDFTDALLSKRPVMSKLGELALQAYNIPRSFMAGIGDLSGTLMQNAMFAYRHPVMTAKNFVQELKFFASENAFKMSGEEIASRPNYSLMKQAKLSLTDVGPIVSQREEQFMGSLAEKIPGLGRLIRATGRAYTGFLNRMRADTFDYMVGVQKGMGGSIEDAKFLKDVGHFINIATGRGDLGQLERIAPVLGQGLFSARKLMATFQTLNPGLYITATPAVRREALLTMLSFMGGATAITQLSKLAGAEVSDDPTNTDYGKIKIGNTRLNMYGPYQQLVVLFARLWKGYATSSTSGRKIMLGDESNPYAPSRLDLLTRYFESKEHPTLSLIAGALRGTNNIGQPFNLPTETLGRLIPMVLGDAYDLYQEHGPIGLLGTIPGILGIPVQTYGSQIPSIGTTPTGRPNVKLNPVPNLEGAVINKITGTLTSNIPQNQWQGFTNAKDLENQQAVGMQNAKEALQTGQTGQMSQDLQPTNFNIDGQDYQGFRVGGKFVYIDEDGVQQTKSIESIKKAQIAEKVSLNSSRMTNLKDKEDYSGWLKVAQEQLQTYQQQLLQATAEKDKLDWENKITDLKTSIEKYKSYGGFKKAKKPAKITIKKAATVKVSMPKLRAGKITIAKPPTAKKITVAPNTKANVINKKFKITKATVKFKKIKYA